MNINNVLYHFQNLLNEARSTNASLGEIYTKEMLSDPFPNSGQLKDSIDDFDDNSKNLDDLKDGYLYVIKGGSNASVPLTSVSKGNRNDNLKELAKIWVESYGKIYGRSLPAGDTIKLHKADECYFYVVYGYNAAYTGPTRASGNFDKMLNPFDSIDWARVVGEHIDGASIGGIGGILDSLLGTKFKFEASQSLELKYPELAKVSLAPPKYNLGISTMMRQIESYVNAYLKKYNIQSEMTVDQRWTSQDDNAWGDLVTDVFLTKRIPGIDGAGVSKEEVSRNWKRASEDLREIGEFPGYTSDVDGVLAFAVDAVNGNNEEGKKKRKEKPRPKSSRGSGRSRAKTVEKPQLPRKSFNDIKIKLQGRLGRNRKADVFIPDIKEILASNLKGGQMASDGNVSFVIDSVAGGKDVSFGKGAGFFESPYSVVRAIQNSLRGLRTKGSIAVEIPRGDYS